MVVALDKRTVAHVEGDFAGRVRAERPGAPAHIGGEVDCGVEEDFARRGAELVAVMLDRLAGMFGDRAGEGGEHGVARVVVEALERVHESIGAHQEQAGRAVAQFTEGGVAGDAVVEPVGRHIPVYLIHDDMRYEARIVAGDQGFVFTDADAAGLAGDQP